MLPFYETGDMDFEMEPGISGHRDVRILIPYVGTRQTQGNRSQKSVIQVDTNRLDS